MNIEEMGIDRLGAVGGVGKALIIYSDTPEYRMCAGKVRRCR